MNNIHATPAEPSVETSVYVQPFSCNRLCLGLSLVFAASLCEAMFILYFGRIYEPLLEFLVSTRYDPVSVILMAIVIVSGINAAMSDSTLTVTKVNLQRTDSLAESDKISAS